MTQHISSLFAPIERPALAVRSAKEDIISQIVERTTADKKLLAKRIALWVNRYKLDTSDRRSQNSTQWGASNYVADVGIKTGVKLRLQPAMTEWMMGYPEGWTELPLVPVNTGKKD